jgi:hypothetical protein
MITFELVIMLFGRYDHDVGLIEWGTTETNHLRDLVDVNAIQFGHGPAASVGMVVSKTGISRPSG